MHSAYHLHERDDDEEDDGGGDGGEQRGVDAEHAARELGTLRHHYGAHSAVHDHCQDERQHQQQLRAQCTT